MRWKYLLCLVLMPFYALAEKNSPAPMLVVGGESSPQAKTRRNATPAPVSGDTLAAQIPKEAVTTLGNPPNPLPPASPAQTATPESPKNPPSPESPASKLWPRDTVPLFLTSCAKGRPKMLQPCQCIITHLMTQMAHDEFLALTETDQIEGDGRYLNIRQACATAPQKR